MCPPTSLNWERVSAASLFCDFKLKLDVRCPTPITCAAAIFL